MVSIYIDMDDVLCESNETFLTVLEKRFNKKVHYDQITTFDLKQSFGLTDEEFNDFFDLIHEPEEMIQHKPVQGAKALLDTWDEKGYRINILTGRPVAAQPVSLEWLDKHQFKYHDFSIVDKYQRDASKGASAMTLDALSQMSFDLAIEDSGQMASFLSEEMNTPVALLDRPWNRSFDFNEKVHRCKDWSQIKAQFEILDR